MERAQPQRRLRSTARAERSMARWLGDDELRCILFCLQAGSLRKAAAVNKLWHGIARALFAEAEWQARGCSLRVLLEHDNSDYRAVPMRLALWSQTLQQKLSVSAADALGLTKPGSEYDSVFALPYHVRLTASCRSICAMHSVYRPCLSSALPTRKAVKRRECSM